MNTKKALNSLAFLLVISGVLLKANHLPGANITLILSGATMLFNLFAFVIKDNKDIGINTTLNYYLGISLALYIVSALFRIQHWPGKDILSSIGYIFAFITPLLFIIYSYETKISKQYFITFFTFFILLLGVYPNNPIAKYLGSGRDYTISEKAANSLKTDSLLKQ